MKRKDTHTGFTLIELMIVMVIMGVLAVIGVTSFMSSQIKGRDATRKGDLNAIAQALELYYNDNSRYPNDGTSGTITGLILGCDGEVGSSPTPAPVVCTPGAVFKNAKGTIYMPQLPKDPNANQVYFYDGNSSGASYKLYAHLENLKDPQCLLIVDGECQSVGVSCGTGIDCNYGIASGNISL